jgi:hypothetical protein
VREAEAYELHTSLDAQPLGNVDRDSAPRNVGLWGTRKRESGRTESFRSRARLLWLRSHRRRASDSHSPIAILCSGSLFAWGEIPPTSSDMLS